MLALVAAVTACAGTNSADATAPVRVLERSAHCPEPPSEAGAARIDIADAGADVDASSDWIVRLGMGQRSTGGYAVDIADPQPVAVEAGIAVVRVEWITPAAGAAVTQVITRPCVEVAVPRVHEGIRFIDAAGTIRGEVLRD
jgi:hypothetical protein